MGDDVEICINQEGTLKAVQHYNIIRSPFRFSVTRAKGSGRHRVFAWPNCNRGVTGLREDAFVRGLKTCFLIVLVLTGIRLFFETSVKSLPSLRDQLWGVVADPRWSLRNRQTDWKAFLLLALIPAAAVSWVFLKKTARKLRERALITELKKQEVKTVSGLVWQGSLNKPDL